MLKTGSQRFQERQDGSRRCGQPLEVLMMPNYPRPVVRTDVRTDDPAKNEQSDRGGREEKANQPNTLIKEVEYPTSHASCPPPALLPAYILPRTW